MSDATITLRNATPKDAADLAIIDNMASHGMSLAFWQHAVEQGEAEDALVYARERFADPSSPFGWSNALVAESGEGQLLGSVTAYEMPEPDGEADWAKQAFPVFVPVFELFAHAVGDWFIDSLGTFPSAREKGVAGALLRHAVEKGERKNLEQVSLVVESLNEPAFSLYEKDGFATVMQLPMVGENDQGDWLLMKRDL